MNKEFIEKLVEWAEGFTIEKMHDPIIVHQQTGQIIDFNSYREWSYYPVLLYRAMEVWNRRHIEAETGNAGWINPENVFAFISDGEIEENISDYEADKYLTAKEKALEAVLMEVLK